MPMIVPLTDANAVRLLEAPHNSAPDIPASVLMLDRTTGGLLLGTSTGPVGLTSFPLTLCIPSIHSTVVDPDSLGWAAWADGVIDWKVAWVGSDVHDDGDLEIAVVTADGETLTQATMQAMTPSTTSFSVARTSIRLGQRIILAVTTAPPSPGFGVSVTGIYTPQFVPVVGLEATP